MRYFMYWSFALSVAVAQVALADEPAKPAAEKTKTGGIVTLYFLDPIANNYSFAKATYSDEIDKEGHLRGIIYPDIDFGHYRENSFTYAFAGPLLGKIVDLGTACPCSFPAGYSAAAHFHQVDQPGDRQARVEPLPAPVV